MKKIILASLLTIISIFNMNAQELKVEIEPSAVNINQLPEYVIITSQNTKLLGGIGITIDAKRSTYKNKLQMLESILQDGDKLRVRNQTDLLNSMSKLGFEYINTYNASAVMPNNDDGDDLLEIIDGGEGSFKVNMVFRKKEKYRD